MGSFTGPRGTGVRIAARLARGTSSCSVEYWKTDLLLRIGNSGCTTHIPQTLGLCGKGLIFWFMKWEWQSLICRVIQKLAMWYETEPNLKKRYWHWHHPAAVQRRKPQDTPDSLDSQSLLVVLSPGPRPIRKRRSVDADCQSLTHGKWQCINRTCKIWYSPLTGFNATSSLQT